MSKRRIVAPCDFVRRHPDKALGVVTRLHGAGFVVRWPDGRHTLNTFDHSGKVVQVSPPPCEWWIATHINKQEHRS